MTATPTRDSDNALEFRIDYQGGVHVLITEDGSCRPATGPELSLWNVLRSSWRTRNSGCANLLDAVLTDSRMPMSARARLRTVRNVIDARLAQEAVARVPNGHLRSIVDWLAPIPPAGTLLYAAAPVAAAQEAVAYASGELDRSAPPRIWLQIDTDGNNDERSGDWPGPDGVTWQDESMGGLEIQYVRADIAAPVAAAPVAHDVPFATVQRVVRALTQVGVATPYSQEEQAARALELIHWLCDEVPKQFASTPSAPGIDLERFRRLANSWIVEAAGGAAEAKHACADELLALIDASPKGGSEAWQPMETAPKSVADGSRVEGIYLLGFIPDDDLVDPQAGIDVIWWEPLLPNSKGGRGKWCANAYGEAVEVLPTGWRHLPAAPATSADAGAFICTGDELRCHDGNGCECVMRGLKPASAEGGSDAPSIPEPHQECYSDNDGDSWYEHPADAELVEGLAVGETYTLTVSHYPVERTYRVTKAPDETSDDYEVEPVQATSAEVGGVSGWQAIDTAPLDQVVVTKIDDASGPRNEQLLIQKQRSPEHRPMWFFPDMSMYVYYTPTHWRPTKPTSHATGVSDE